MALRLAGLVPAYWIARGVENDSAKSTIGTEGGQVARTTSINSEYGRQRSTGYRIVKTSTAGGRTRTKSLNRSPVPSNPGRSTSFSKRFSSLYFTLLALIVVNRPSRSQS